MNRRTLLQITTCTVSAAMANYPAARADEQVSTPEEQFLFGTHIYREPHLPLDQLRHDLPILKRLGFNMVKIQESWAIDEKREGEIDLQNVLQVVADARDHGLKVYFGVTMEQAPAWLWQKYPDAYMVMNTGEAYRDELQYVIPQDGKPGPCWHHPDARQSATRFLTAVGQQVGRYDNLAVWNVWQELGFGNVPPGHLGFCYCKHTMHEFRAWLVARYGSVQNLNSRWKTGYGSIEEIIPPRVAPDLPPYLDFRYFMEDVYLSGVLRWKAEALHASDPLSRPVFAHSDSATLGSSQQWNQARSLDFFGGSEYPAWAPFGDWDTGRAPSGKSIDPIEGMHAELWNAILLRFDYLRCATPGGRIWAAEFQGGPVVRGLQRGRVPDGADIRRWVLGALAAGITGLSFWNHRAEIFWREEQGFGLLELDGDEVTPRAAAAGELATALNQHAALFNKGTVPQAQIAMLVSEDLYQFHKATIHDYGFAPPFDHFIHTIRGIYKSLWDAGISIDFLPDTELAIRGAAYSAIVLPFPASMKDSCITDLIRYVENGGVLLSECCPGRLNELGFAAPGAMPVALRKLFGATHEDLVMIREPNDKSLWTGQQAAYGDTVAYRDLRGSGVSSGRTIMPAYLLQTFKPTTAIPILLDGERVAGCVNAYGKGKAYLVGTLLGHATLSYDNSCNAKFLTTILNEHGISGDTVGKLRRRRREYRGQAAWFLFNISGETVEESVPVPPNVLVADLSGVSLPVTSGCVRVSVTPMAVQCLILRG